MCVCACAWLYPFWLKPFQLETASALVFCFCGPSQHFCSNLLDGMGKYQGREEGCERKGQWSRQWQGRRRQSSWRERRALRRAGECPWRGPPEAGCGASLPQDMDGPADQEDGRKSGQDASCVHEGHGVYEWGRQRAGRWCSRGQGWKVGVRLWFRQLCIPPAVQDLRVRQTIRMHRSRLLQPLWAALQQGQQQQQ